MKDIIKSVSALALIGPTFLMGGSAPIGFVQASGEFRVNQAAVYGTGTLFDGALLETYRVRSDVSFSSGGHLALAPNSKTHVYRTYAVLETGAADVNAPGYTLKAGGLSISGSGAQVILDSPTRLRVGAASTSVEVRDRSNLLIARVYPGRPLEFAGGGQGGASGPVSISGTLGKNGNQYVLSDSTTNTTYQIVGSNLDKLVGTQVKVVGSLVAGAAAGSVPVVVATSVVAAAAVAGGLGAAAIAGIVVAGATATGLGVAAATGSFSSASAQ